jgi:hypothetical protein
VIRPDLTAGALGPSTVSLKTNLLLLLLLLLHLLLLLLLLFLLLSA